MRTLAWIGRFAGWNLLLRCVGEESVDSPYCWKA